MKRRAALALALCLTTIVGFFIVGYGMQIGFFGGGSGPGDAAAQADPTVEPTQPPAAAPSEPQVIEQYVYRDVFVSNPGEGAESTGSAGATGGEAAPNPPQETAPITQAKPPAPTATPTPQQTPQAAPKSVEFTGEVTAVSGSTFTVDSRSGQFTVTIDPSTRVHGGSIEVGATVKVHGQQGADGVVSAGEIEVGGDD